MKIQAMRQKRKSDVTKSSLRRSLRSARVSLYEMTCMLEVAEDVEGVAYEAVFMAALLEAKRRLEEVEHSVDVLVGNPHEEGA